MNKLLTKTVGILFMLLLLMAPSTIQGKRITFTPQWHANAQFAGYIAARELGFYEEEGLDVTILYPGNSKTSIEMLRDGEADLVSTALATAIASNVNEGVDLVNVMQTSQHASICLALKSPKERFDLNSLREMRVGIWYNGLAMSAVAMNEQHHLAWNIVPFRKGFKLLSYGVMDAITVMEYNELLQLKYHGFDVSERSVLRLCDHGYDIPEDGVYCTNEYYKQNANEVNAFVRATKKGWEWCRKHPEEATKYVVKEMEVEHVNYSEVIQLDGLKVILKKQEVAPGKVSYRLRQDQFSQAVKMLKLAGLIHSNPEFKTFIAR